MMGRVMADLARLGAPILGPSMASVTGRMPDDKWQMANDKWQMADDEWQMADDLLPKSKMFLPSVMFHLSCFFPFGCLFRCNELSPEAGPGVLFIVVGELLDQSPAGVVDGPGHDDSELDEKVAIRLAARGGNTLSLESQLQS